MIGRAHREERGAYAVLFALLVTVLVGIVALVVDIGLLRTDRRIDKAATDSAAIAGATRLGASLQPNPKAACGAAIAFLQQNLPGVSGDLSTLCSGFPAPGQSGYSSCPTTALSGTGTLTGNGGTYQVSVTWPVFDSSPLMAPDIRPTSSAVTQVVVPDDGTPCTRFGVAISHTRATLFAGIFGQGSEGTSNHSVARIRIGAGNGRAAAPLVILDPHLCNALTAEGGGGVQIQANSDGVPGLIAVNSDGTGSNCNGGAATINSNAQNGTNSEIWAWDSPKSKAAILSFAITAGQSDSYNPAQVTCSSSSQPSGPLCPQPTGLAGQIPRQAFIDNLYNCHATQVGTCDSADDPKNGIGQLRGLARSMISSVPSGGPAPSGWTLITGNACTSPQPSYTGPVYVDCTSSNGGFTVGGGASAVFDGGPVIFAGDVKVKAGGCLLFNVAPADVSAACSSPTLASQPQDGPVVFMAGQINVNSTNSSFIAPQTFVMEGDCAFDGSTCARTPANLTLQTAGTGNILWSAPLGPNLPGNNPPACTPGNSTSAPSAACFANLAVWDEYASTSSTPDTVSGQASLLLQGTFFTPNAQFVLSGGSLTNIQNAQFVTGRLDVHGGGLLTMVPNAALTNPPPLITAGLIR